MLSESGALTCMATHTNQNGTVQRRAARWVVSDYSRTSIVTSMLHILARLEKSTIKEGRCQTYTYMYVQDHSFGSTRPHGRITIAQLTPLLFSRFKTQKMFTNIYSFFPFTIVQWNRLPGSDVSLPDVVLIISNWKWAN